MSRKKSKTKPTLKPNSRVDLNLIEDPSKERVFDIAVAVLLFGWGIYHSILYFGHWVVPNPDFTAFVRAGREILSFELPTSYKRAPVLGMLQVILSWFVGGGHPELTAGWLLNAILHPFNLILFYFVSKRIIGKTAAWLAIPIILNPWIIQMLQHPLVETTLLFFTLLTFFLMFRRSRWCYLTAAVTAMVRYEGAALIFAAFVWDMIDAPDNKQRIKSFFYSAAASIPLALWMLGTFLQFKAAGQTHYLKELGEGGQFGKTLLRYITMLWQVGFGSFFMPDPAASQDTSRMIMALSKLTVAISLIFGSVYGFIKKKWEILALLLFFVPYVFVHVMHSFVLPRFCSVVTWGIILICLYGLQSIWGLINKNGRVPKPAAIIFQAIALLIAAIWLFKLMPYLSKVAPMSKRSASVPYVAMTATALLFIIHRLIYRTRFAWKDTCIAVVICLMVVSNQPLLSKVVSNGEMDIEFKQLADWHIANAKPEEKMVTSMANICRIFAPRRKDSFIHLGSFKSENPQDFLKKCYEENISYVVWDSRTGSYPGYRYYKLWGYSSIAMLAKPQSIGPYEFVTQIKANNQRYLNIFRLKRPQPK